MPKTPSQIKAGKLQTPSQKRMSVPTKTVSQAKVTATAGKPGTSLKVTKKVQTKNSKMGKI